MAFRQAQDLFAVVYKIERTIPLGRRLYTVDICCCGNDEVGISAVNSDESDVVVGVKQSPSGLYIICETNVWNTNFIYGTDDSVFCRSIQNREYKIWPEPGIQEEYPITFGILPKQGFSPRGLAVRKSGGTMICLWNNEVGQRSYGKVIVIGGNHNFQIFTDKNTPCTFVPPT